MLRERRDEHHFKSARKEMKRYFLDWKAGNLDNQTSILWALFTPGKVIGFCILKLVLIILVTVVLPMLRTNNDVDVNQTDIATPEVDRMISSILDDEHKNDQGVEAKAERINDEITDPDEAYCKQILDHYQTDRADISFSGKYNFFSELKQDWFLYETMFRHMDEPGVYIDLAANDYRKGSNTYFLDKCLKWKGICIEAQQTYWENIEKDRTCTLEKVCIYSERKMMNFGNTGNGLGGLHGFMRGDLADTDNANLMQCETLQSRIESAGITHIDYLSLDIEGAEYEALKGVQWNLVTIDVISIEHPELKEGLQEFLEGLGYEAKIWINGVDVVFVHKDSTQKIGWIVKWMSEEDWRTLIPCKPYGCSTVP